MLFGLCGKTIGFRLLGGLTLCFGLGSRIGSGLFRGGGIGFGFRGSIRFGLCRCGGIGFGLGGRIGGSLLSGGGIGFGLRGRIGGSLLGGGRIGFGLRGQISLDPRGVICLGGGFRLGTAFHARVRQQRCQLLHAAHDIAVDDAGKDGVDAIGRTDFHFALGGKVVRQGQREAEAQRGAGFDELVHYT